MSRLETQFKIGPIDTSGYNSDNIYGFCSDVRYPLGELTEHALGRRSIQNPISADERRLFEGLNGLGHEKDFREQAPLGFSYADRSAGAILSLRGPVMLQATETVSANGRAAYLMIPEGAIIGSPFTKSICDLKAWADGDRVCAFEAGNQTEIKWNAHRLAPYHADFEPAYLSLKSEMNWQGDILKIGDSIRMFIPVTTQLALSHRSAIGTNPICAQTISTKEFLPLGSFTGNALLPNDLIFQSLPESIRGNEARGTMFQSASVPTLYFAVRTEPTLSLIVYDTANNPQVLKALRQIRGAQSEPICGRISRGSSGPACTIEIHSFRTPRQFASFWLTADSTLPNYAFKLASMS